MSAAGVPSPVWRVSVPVRPFVSVRQRSAWRDIERSLSPTRVPVRVPVGAAVAVGAPRVTFSGTGCRAPVAVRAAAPEQATWRGDSASFSGHQLSSLDRFSSWSQSLGRGGRGAFCAAGGASPELHLLPGRLPRQGDFPSASGPLEEQRFRVQPVWTRVLPHHTHGRHCPVPRNARVCVVVCSVFTRALNVNSTHARHRARSDAKAPTALNAKSALALKRPERALILGSRWGGGLTLNPPKENLLMTYFTLLAFYRYCYPTFRLL